MTRIFLRLMLFRLTFLCAAAAAAALFVLPVQAAAEAAAEEEPIRILTINVRCSTANDGENGWIHRKTLMTGLIAGGNYDFVGTQETVIHSSPERNQAEYLAAEMPKYGSLYRSREKETDRGEAMMILYKKERWKMDETDNGTFWLSGTPDVPGSKTDPKAGCTRSVTFGLFHELKNNRPTGQKIYIYDTHFDHQSEMSRQLGAKIALERIAARKDKKVPVVLMGDLNCGEKSPAIRFLQGESMTMDGSETIPPCKLTDTFRAVNPKAADVGTYHGFKKPHKDKIDWIFVSEPLKTVSSQIIRTQKDGRYPTDHFPVEAVITR